MGAPEQKKTWPAWIPKLAAIFCLWVGGVAALNIIHLSFGWYHEGPLHYIFCFMFSLPPVSIALGVPTFIGWLWATRLTPLRKVCFTVIAIAVGIPAFCVSGFV